jgi:ATP-dependent exoDNAse (exonuclease V) beta subunit (contains helicase and exonuclease domains)
MAELSLPYFREVNVKFTAIQSEIINDRKNNLYVPASAGTGKTTVMINRIVDLICDGTVSVNNLLIITFTNAAASEMAERLENKLTERAAINTELYSILADLPSVAIGTLDGFFNRLVKEFFYIVNIDPTYRLMDEAEANALRKRVLKDVLESFYEKGDESFFRLLQIFGRNSNEGLLIMVDRLSHIIENIPDVDNWLKEAENEDKLYEAACFGMGNYIKDYCSGIAKEIKELITEAKYNDCEKKLSMKWRFF